MREDVLGWFKGTGKGYQTRIDNELRAFVESRKRSAGRGCPLRQPTATCGAAEWDNRPKRRSPRIWHQTSLWTNRMITLSCQSDAKMVQFWMGAPWLPLRRWRRRRYGWPWSISRRPMNHPDQEQSTMGTSTDRTRRRDEFITKLRSNRQWYRRRRKQLQILWIGLTIFNLCLGFLTSIFIALGWPGYRQPHGQGDAGDAPRGS